MNQDPHLNRYIREVDTAEVLLDKFQQRSKGMQARCGEWMSLVVESVAGDFIGFMGICLTDEALGQWEEGYLMASGQQGNGYTTAVLKLLALGQARTRYP
ncbi:GNAT family N-acetyltransferase [Shewanella yunxiaonensis]|uniref:GNAT family N-acetyltransferase n=1 Tax=Shewanella yunxiaonensis TaxID=2829809 RepID=A0ABX7YY46_9GAMM|nr:GNAT family N-acetyltransferase [Shewanella yunxiaonensis]